MATSPKTRPTTRQAWPRSAEWARRDIKSLAEDGRDLVRDALAALDDGNPLLARAQLALIAAALADIQRIAVEASIGIVPQTAPEEP